MNKNKALEIYLLLELSYRALDKSFYVERGEQQDDYIIEGMDKILDVQSILRESINVSFNEISTIVDSHLGNTHDIEIDEMLKKLEIKPKKRRLKWVTKL